MRVVFVGASELAVLTAVRLVASLHEVVVIDRDRARIDEVSADLDCAFLHGDGSKPAILREAQPEVTDVLFCLTDHDQSNILAALVGRSLGFKRVVPLIKDLEFETICKELGLRDVIVPVETACRHLVDMVAGLDAIELSPALRGEARIHTYTLREAAPDGLAGLGLPERVRLACVYRGDALRFPGEHEALREGDEVVLVTDQETLAELEGRLAPLAPPASPAPPAPPEEEATPEVPPTEG